MSTSHEESWPTATNPRHLLKLTRVRPSGRQYALLACAVVRHLMPGARTELGARVLTALERFAVVQPRKGVQTHLWSDMVRRAVPEIPNPIPLNWQKFGADRPWAWAFADRLKALSQVDTAPVNVVLDLALRESDSHDRLAAWREAERRCAGRSVADMRAEIVARVGPERYAAARALWAGVADDRIPHYFLFAEALERRKGELNAKACGMIREVFGNPFRPPHVRPDWLAWNHGAVRHIAEAALASGDFTDLPILADALEDAGCTDADLLAHLRSGGPHAPGCWALDAVLGK